MIILITNSVDCLLIGVGVVTVISLEWGGGGKGSTRGVVGP